MTEAHKNPEPQTPVTFEQLRNAFGVFKDDYNIVRHPNTPTNTPFNPPNGLDDEGHRQYNLTLLPADMTEEQFLEELHAPQGIVLAVGCMDRDAALPAYNEIGKVYPGKKIVYLTMAGGMVQMEQPRKEALRTMLTYFSQHQENIETVLATDHDHTCGKIKVDLGGVPLAEKIGSSVAEVGHFAQSEEQTTMKSLILGGITETGLDNLFPGKVIPGLVEIDRQGGVKLNTDFQGIQAKTINQIRET